MSDDLIRTPVLIAGGGPVGLVLALELGVRGVDCVLLNDRPDTATHPKANAIGARTMEHLRRLGVASRVRASGLADDHPTDVAYFTGLDGFELARLNMPSRTQALAEARAGAGHWASPEPPHRCSQIYLERHLKARAEELPAIDLRFGWRLVEFEDRDSHVTAIAEEVATGRRVTFEADYLVGADAGNSIVRKTLGIEYEGESGVVRPFMGGSMYAAYFRARDVSSWLKVARSWQYWVFNPRVRGLLIHVDDTDRFLLQTNMPKDGGPVDAAGILREMAGREAPIEILSAVPWTAGFSLVAQRFVAGRVFLVGDSSHLFTPTGGMGMNTGVDDAANLGWKLAALCAGWGGDGLAQSYDDERRPIGHRNVNFARGFADSVGTVPITEDVERDTPAGRAERDALGARLGAHAFSEFIIPGIMLGVRYGDSSIVDHDGTDPPPEDPNAYAPNACPGARAPHVWMGEGEALYDRLGPGFTLLRLGGSRADVSAIEEAAAACRAPLEILDVPGPAARDLYAADLVLVRPDQHVAWRGNRSPPDAAALIDTARGALAD